MPKLEELPEDIGAITTRNALPLRHESFDDDVENIVTAVLGGRHGNGPGRTKARCRQKLLTGLVERLLRLPVCHYRHPPFLDARTANFSLDWRAFNHASADRPD